jgi:hypothetical protein
MHALHGGGAIVLIGQLLMGVGQRASHWGVIRATLGDNRGDGWCVWRRARTSPQACFCVHSKHVSGARVSGEASECRCMAWEHHVGVVVEMWWLCGGGDGGGGDGGVPSDRVWGVKGKGVRCVCGSNLPCL